MTEKSNGQTAVEFRNVRKVYSGGFVALHDLTLRVPAGRVLALLGPSGCGKTTTLRLINRLEQATSGDVLVRGDLVRGMRPEKLRRSIGYVIQEAGLLPHLTVRANVGTVPRLLGWPRERIARRVGEVLEQVGLPESQYGDRKPAELSGGQRQRVGVARGLAADPDLLLMDEPFGALDPGTRESLQNEFLTLIHKLHKTVVIVTHDVAEAGLLADEIVVMHAGRIAQRGTLRDVLIRPASEEVRTFLGSRRSELALSVLRLGELLDDLPAVQPAADNRELAASMPLGQVLVLLEGAPEEATITVNNGSVKSIAAPSLRTLLLEELRRAEQ